MKKHLILLTIFGLSLFVMACAPKFYYHLDLSWLSDESEAIVEPLNNTAGKIIDFNTTGERDYPDKFEQMERLKGEYDSIIVKFNPEYDVRKMNFTTKSSVKFHKYGSFQPDTVSKSNIAVVKPVDTRNIDWKEMILYYESLPEVAFAEPNYKTYAHATDPTDPYYSYQWHMKDLNIPEVWEQYTKGDVSVIAAVLDSGIAYTDDPNTSQDNGVAPDFQTTSFMQGWDFINNDPIAYDDNSHGTHVAGTIAARDNDGEACVGMAPEITLMPFKVMGATGGGYVSNTVSAIYKAMENGAHIINMSLGSKGYSESEKVAVKEAHRAGLLLFASSGNENAPVSYPAALDKVVAVGASNSRHSVTYYSNYGDEIDIVAPGGDSSDQDGDGQADRVVQQTIRGYNPHTEVVDYEFGIYGFSGTSMSCPHAVGLASLIKSHYLELDNKSIESIIKNTADDIEKNIFNEEFGYGIINPLSALQATDMIKTSGTDKVYHHHVGKAILYDKAIITQDEHKIDVAGGKIKIKFYINDNPPINSVSLIYDGNEVASSTEGYMMYDVGENTGEYIIRVDIEAEDIPQ